MFSEFCNCCADADKVLVTDEFAAGELPIVGVDKTALVSGLKNAGVDAFELESEAVLAREVLNHANANDLVVCMGAGSISLWANVLPEQLQAFQQKVG